MSIVTFVVMTAIAVTCWANASPFNFYFSLSCALIGMMATVQVRPVYFGRLWLGYDIRLWFGLLLGLQLRLVLVKGYGQGFSKVLGPRLGLGYGLLESEMYSTTENVAKKPQGLPQNGATFCRRLLSWRTSYEKNVTVPQNVVDTDPTQNVATSPEMQPRWTQWPVTQNVAQKKLPVMD